MVIRVTLTRCRDPHSPIADGLEGCGDFPTLQEPGGDVTAHEVSSKQLISIKWERTMVLFGHPSWLSALIGPQRFNDAFTGTETQK